MCSYCYSLTIIAAKCDVQLKISDGQIIEV